VGALDQPGVLEPLDGVGDPAAAVREGVGQLCHPHPVALTLREVSDTSKARRRSSSSLSVSSVIPMMRARHDRCCPSSSHLVPLLSLTTRV
jgi:hypothetical protein